MGSECCKCHSEKNAHHQARNTSLLSTVSSNYIRRSRSGQRTLSNDRFRPYRSSLAIRQLTFDDAGHYSAESEDSYGASMLASIDLNVQRRKPEVPVFLKRLHDISVKIGSRARFLVEIGSIPPIKITWYHDNQILRKNERLSFLNEDRYYCLDVGWTVLQDEGHWTCIAENKHGCSVSSAYLTILVPKAYKAPRFVDELKAILSDDGTVSLECKVIGVPTPTLYWYKDGKKITAGDTFALRANSSDSSSLGTYSCVAKNCLGQAFSSSSIHFHSEGQLSNNSSAFLLGPQPEFVRQLRNAEAQIETQLMLSCQVVVPPWPKTIDWYNKSGRVLDNEKYKMIADGLGMYALEIKKVEMMDDGEWKCVATSFFGIKAFTSCYVSVKFPKNYKTPKFLENLKAIMTPEGLVSFECKVIGYPTPQLKWLKDGKELKPGDVYQLTGTNSLGTYCCIAKNSMGEISSTTVLTLEDIQSQLTEEERLMIFAVNQPPYFVKGLSSQELQINDEFKFHVQVSAKPDPKIFWYRNDELIEKNERISMLKEEHGNFFLHLKRVELDDQVEWKAIAINDYGQSVTSCFVKLVVPKHFKVPRFLEQLKATLTKEGTVNLECKVIGVPQPELRWYKDGKCLKSGEMHRIISGTNGTCRLGIYTCEALNCMGIVTSSASLLAYEEEERECGKLRKDNNLDILSIITEERSSQLNNSDKSVTYEEAAGVSFSFDGKEVSISLYETPDLTEEEALQIVEMYANELTDQITDKNIVELPSLRFVKETVTSGNILMEATVIDVNPNEFYNEEELKTDADIENSMMDDSAFLTNNSLISEIDKCNSKYQPKQSNQPPKETPPFTKNSSETLLDAKLAAPLDSTKASILSLKSDSIDDVSVKDQQQGKLATPPTLHSPTLRRESVQKRASFDSEDDSLYEFEKLKAQKKLLPSSEKETLQTMEKIESTDVDSALPDQKDLSILESVALSISTMELDLDKIQNDLICNKDLKEDVTNYTLNVLNSLLQPIHEIKNSLETIEARLTEGDDGEKKSILHALCESITEFRNLVSELEKVEEHENDRTFHCRRKSILEAVVQPLDEISKGLYLIEAGNLKPSVSSNFKIYAEDHISDEYSSNDDSAHSNSISICSDARKMIVILNEYNKELENLNVLVQQKRNSVQYDENMLKTCECLNSVVQQLKDVRDWSYALHENSIKTPLFGSEHIEDIMEFNSAVLQFLDTNINVVKSALQTSVGFSHTNEFLDNTSPVRTNLEATLTLTSKLSPITATHYLTEALKAYVSISYEFSKNRGLLQDVLAINSDCIKSIEDSIDTILNSLDTMEKCSPIENVYFRKRVLLALCKIRMPMQHLAITLHSVEKQFFASEDDIGTMTGLQVYTLVNIISEPLQMVRKEIGLILNDCQSHENMHETTDALLKLVTSPLRDFQDSITAFHNIVFNKEPVNIDANYVLSALNNLNPPLCELANNMLKAEELILQDAPVVSDPKLGIRIVMQSVSSLIKAIFSLQSDSLPENHSITETLSRLNEPLVEVKNCLRDINDKFYEEDPEKVNITMLKTLSNPFNLLQKELIEANNVLALSGDIKNTITDLQRTILTIQDQVSFEYGDEPASIEYNIMTLQTLLQPLNVLRDHCIAIREDLQKESPSLVYIIDSLEKEQIKIINDIDSLLAELMKDPTNQQYPSNLLRAIHSTFHFLKKYKSLLTTLKEPNSIQNATLSQNVRYVLHKMHSDFDKIEQNIESEELKHELGKIVNSVLNIEQAQNFSSLSASLQSLSSLTPVFSKILLELEVLSKVDIQDVDSVECFIAFLKSLNTLRTLQDNVRNFQSSSNTDSIQIPMLLSFLSSCERLEIKVSELLSITENVVDQNVKLDSQFYKQAIEAFTVLNNQLIHLNKCLIDQSMSDDNQKEIPFETSINAFTSLLPIISGSEVESSSLKEVNSIIKDGVIDELKRLKNDILFNMSLIQSEDEITFNDSEQYEDVLPTNNPDLVNVCLNSIKEEIKKCNKYFNKMNKAQLEQKLDYIDGIALSFENVFNILNFINRNISLEGEEIFIHIFREPVMQMLQQVHQIKVFLDKYKKDSTLGLNVQCNILPMLAELNQNFDNFKSILASENTSYIIGTSSSEASFSTAGSNISPSDTQEFQPIRSETLDRGEDIIDSIHNDLSSSTESVEYTTVKPNQIIDLSISETGSIDEKSVIIDSSSPSSDVLSDLKTPRGDSISPHLEMINNVEVSKDLKWEDKPVVGGEEGVVQVLQFVDNQSQSILKIYEVEELEMVKNNEEELEKQDQQLNTEMIVEEKINIPDKEANKRSASHHLIVIDKEAPSEISQSTHETKPVILGNLNSPLDSIEDSKLSHTSINTDIENPDRLASNFDLNNSKEMKPEQVETKTEEQQLQEPLKFDLIQVIENLPNTISKLDLKEVFKTETINNIETTLGISSEKFGILSRPQQLEIQEHKLEEVEERDIEDKDLITLVNTNTLEEEQTLIKVEFPNEAESTSLINLDSNKEDQSLTTEENEVLKNVLKEVTWKKVESTETKTKEEPNNSEATTFIIKLDQDKNGSIGEIKGELSIKEENILEIVEAKTDNLKIISQSTKIKESTVPEKSILEEVKEKKLGSQSMLEEIDVDNTAKLTEKALLELSTEAEIRTPKTDQRIEFNKGEGTVKKADLLLESLDMNTKMFKTEESKIPQTAFISQLEISELPVVEHKLKQRTLPLTKEDTIEEYWDTKDNECSRNYLHQIKKFSESISEQESFETAIDDMESSQCDELTDWEEANTLELEVQDINIEKMDKISLEIEEKKADMKRSKKIDFGKEKSKVIQECTTEDSTSIALQLPEKAMEMKNENLIQKIEREFFKIEEVPVSAMIADNQIRKEELQMEYLAGVLQILQTEEYQVAKTAIGDEAALQKCKQVTEILNIETKNRQIEEDQNLQTSIMEENQNLKTEIFNNESTSTLEVSVNPQVESISLVKGGCQNSKTEENLSIKSDLLVESLDTKPQFQEKIKIIKLDLEAKAIENETKEKFLKIEKNPTPQNATKEDSKIRKEEFQIEYLETVPQSLQMLDIQVPKRGIMSKAALQQCELLNETLDLETKNVQIEDGNHQTSIIEENLNLNSKISNNENNSKVEVYESPQVELISPDKHQNLKIKAIGAENKSNIDLIVESQDKKPQLQEKIKVIKLDLEAKAIENGTKEKFLKTEKIPTPQNAIIEGSQIRKEELKIEYLETVPQSLQISESQIPNRATVDEAASQIYEVVTEILNIETKNVQIEDDNLQRDIIEENLKNKISKIESNSKLESPQVEIKNFAIKSDLIVEFQDIKPQLEEKKDIMKSELEAKEAKNKTEEEFLKIDKIPTPQNAIKGESQITKEELQTEYLETEPQSLQMLDSQVPKRGIVGKAALQQCELVPVTEVLDIETKNDHIEEDGNLQSEENQTLKIKISNNENESKLEVHASPQKTISESVSLHKEEDEYQYLKSEEVKVKENYANIKSDLTVESQNILEIDEKEEIKVQIGTENASQQKEGVIFEKGNQDSIPIKTASKTESIHFEINENQETTSKQATGAEPKIELQSKYVDVEKAQHLKCTEKEEPQTAIEDKAILKLELKIESTDVEPQIINVIENSKAQQHSIQEDSEIQETEVKTSYINTEKIDIKIKEGEIPQNATIENPHSVFTQTELDRNTKLEKLETDQAEIQELETKRDESQFPEQDRVVEDIANQISNTKLVTSKDTVVQETNMEYTDCHIQECEKLKENLDKGLLTEKMKFRTENSRELETEEKLASIKESKIQKSELELMNPIDNIQHLKIEDNDASKESIINNESEYRINNIDTKFQQSQVIKPQNGNLNTEIDNENSNEIRNNLVNAEKTKTERLELINENSNRPKTEQNDIIGESKIENGNSEIKFLNPILKTSHIEEPDASKNVEMNFDEEAANFNTDIEKVEEDKEIQQIIIKEKIETSDKISKMLIIKECEIPQKAKIKISKQTAQNLDIEVEKKSANFSILDTDFQFIGILPQSIPQTEQLSIETYEEVDENQKHKNKININFVEININPYELNGKEDSLTEVQNLQIKKPELEKVSIKVIESEAKNEIYTNIIQCQVNEQELICENELMMETQTLALEEAQHIEADIKDVNNQIEGTYIVQNETILCKIEENDSNIKTQESDTECEQYKGTGNELECQAKLEGSQPKMKIKSKELTENMESNKHLKIIEISASDKQQESENPEIKQVSPEKLKSVDRNVEHVEVETTELRNDEIKNNLDATKLKLEESKSITCNQETSPMEESTAVKKDEKSIKIEELDNLPKSNEKKKSFKKKLRDNKVHESQKEEIEKELQPIKTKSEVEAIESKKLEQSNVQETLDIKGETTGTTELQPLIESSKSASNIEQKMESKVTESVRRQNSIEKNKSKINDKENKFRKIEEKAVEKETFPLEPTTENGYVFINKNCNRKSMRTNFTNTEMKDSKFVQNLEKESANGLDTIKRCSHQNYDHSEVFELISAKDRKNNSYVNGEEPRKEKISQRTMNFNPLRHESQYVYTNNKISDPSLSKNHLKKYCTEETDYSVYQSDDFKHKTTQIFPNNHQSSDYYLEYYKYSPKYSGHKPVHLDDISQKRISPINKCLQNIASSENKCRVTKLDFRESSANHTSQASSLYLDFIGEPFYNKYQWDSETPEVKISQIDRLHTLSSEYADSASRFLYPDRYRSSGSSIDQSSRASSTSRDYCDDRLHLLSCRQRYSSTTSDDTYTEYRPVSAPGYLLDDAHLHKDLYSRPNSPLYKPSSYRKLHFRDDIYLDYSYLRSDNYIPRAYVPRHHMYLHTNYNHLQKSSFSYEFYHPYCPYCRILYLRYRTNNWSDYLWSEKDTNFARAHRYRLQSGDSDFSLAPTEEDRLRYVHQKMASENQIRSKWASDSDFKKIIPSNRGISRSREAEDLISKHLWDDKHPTRIYFSSNTPVCRSRFLGANINNFGNRIPSMKHNTDVGLLPRFKQLYAEDTVPLGATVTFHVEVEGTPKPNIEWLKEEKTLVPTPKRYRYIEDTDLHTLVISDITHNDAGKYRCKVWNRYGVADAYTSINVVTATRGNPPRFISRPETIMCVNCGSDVSVSFRLSGNPKPRVSWMKGLADITETHRTLKETVNDYTRLTLKRAQISDAGTYFIIAKNKYGADRAFFTLRVNQRSRSLTPMPIYKYEFKEFHTPSADRTSANIYNKVPGPVPDEPCVTDYGKHYLTLSWRKPLNCRGAPIMAYRVEKWLVGEAGGAKWIEVGMTPTTSLDIYNLRAGEQYNFRITARNQYGWGESVVTSTPVTFQDETVFPEFEKCLPGELKVLYDTSIELECQIKHDKEVVIEWSKNGASITNYDKNELQYRDGKCCLKIKNLNEDDSGRYMCEASNKHGKICTFVRLMVVRDQRLVNANLRLNRLLHENDGKIDMAPLFSMRLRDRRIQMCYPVRLTCQVRGYPKPSVIWFKDNMRIEENQYFSIYEEADDFHSLEINNTKPEHSGTYSIQATNSSGTVSCKCELVVDKGLRTYIGPKFVDKLEKVYSLQEGSELRLRAVVCAYPAVGVTWQKNGVPLRQNRRIIVTVSHEGEIKLTIAQMKQQDSGIYTCTATNEAGSAETNTRIEVYRKQDSSSSEKDEKENNELYSKEPKFLVKPRSFKAAEGDHVVIECKIIGDPKPTVSWLRDRLKTLKRDALFNSQLRSIGTTFLEKYNPPRASHVREFPLITIALNQLIPLNVTMIEWILIRSETKLENAEMKMLD